MSFVSHGKDTISGLHQQNTITDLLIGLKGHIYVSRVLETHWNASANQHLYMLFNFKGVVAYFGTNKFLYWYMGDHLLWLLLKIVWLPRRINGFKHDRLTYKKSANQSDVHTLQRNLALQPYSLAFSKRGEKRQPLIFLYGFLSYNILWSTACSYL